MVQQPKFPIVFTGIVTHFNTIDSSDQLL